MIRQIGEWTEVRPGVLQLDIDVEMPLQRHGVIRPMTENVQDAIDSLDEAAEELQSVPPSQARTRALKRIERAKRATAKIPTAPVVVDPGSPAIVVPEPGYVPDWYDEDDYPSVASGSVWEHAIGGANTINMRSIEDDTIIGSGSYLTRIDGYGEPRTKFGMVRSSVITPVLGNHSALHRFRGDHMAFEDCTFEATNYALYAHDDPLTRAKFTRCQFRERHGGDKVEANVRCRDGAKHVYRECENIKSVRQHNDPDDYMKSAWRFYRQRGLWIDGGRTVGSFRIGSDNSPDSFGTCEDIAITRHTIEHPGLFAPGHGTPGWAIELGDQGDVADFTFGGDITSPNTEHAIIATAPCEITILPGSTFNGQPMTMEHVRWR